MIFQCCTDQLILLVSAGIGWGFVFRLTTLKRLVRACIFTNASGGEDTTTEVIPAILPDCPAQVIKIVIDTSLIL